MVMIPATTSSTGRMTPHMSQPDIGRPLSVVVIRTPLLTRLTVALTLRRNSASGITPRG
jgi:hypothetical protein